VISITAVVLWQYFLTILITLNIAVVKLSSLFIRCIYYAGKPQRLILPSQTRLVEINIGEGVFKVDKKVQGKFCQF
jgi:hypothetical protein